MTYAEQEALDSLRDNALKAEKIARELAQDGLVAVSKMNTELREALKWALAQVAPDPNLSPDELADWRKEFTAARTALEGK